MLQTAFRLALALSFSVGVFALSCVEVPPCARLGPNVIFFRGKVLDAKESLSKRTNWTGGSPIDAYDVRYLAIEGLWGIAARQVVTVSATGSHRPGTVEFVEAWREPTGLVTNECGSGNPAEMIKLFRLRPNVKGKLTIAADEMFIGSTMLISGMVESTLTISKEAWSRMDLVPGQYHIRVRRPGAKQDLIHEVVDLPPGGCPFVFLRGEAGDEN